jgi:Uma2 family endonuclease
LQSRSDDGIVVVELEKSVMAPAPLLTTDEYLRTPETLVPAELVYGAFRVAESPSVRHQQAVGAFYLALVPHVRAGRLGRVLLSPLDIIVDWDRGLILQPDLVFISHARWRTRQERIVCAPDVVLEVLSPHPRIGGLEERLAWFAEYGVREIWLLHQTTERFEILRTDERRIDARTTFDYLEPIRSAVLPGFRRTVADILDDDPNFAAGR